MTPAIRSELQLVFHFDAETIDAVERLAAQMPSVVDAASNGDRRMLAALMAQCIVSGGVDQLVKGAA